MLLSPAGLHLIAGFEGYVPHPYNDAAGNCTIGYGHLIGERRCTPADIAEWEHATQTSLLEQLRSDAGVAVAAVAKSVRVRLGIIPGRAQTRFDALCSLAFNIGGGAFASSSLVQQINHKGAPRDWTPLGPYWLEWDHAGGHVLPGLLNRRRVEFAIFRAGTYPV
jgi:GH24 family phage-related lysozyme (muramidase)